jgi:hypothetical protein
MFYVVISPPTYNRKWYKQLLSGMYTVIITIIIIIFIYYYNLLQCRYSFVFIKMKLNKSYQKINLQYRIDLRLHL